ncbi:MAG: hypothetical protein KME49_25625 [Brasilonema octagenarum HA4186-MV1]|jgi:hypothetical protein|nr:hypothetical protein [Brasilonema octagenarum HA4186-MV1]
MTSEVSKTATQQEERAKELIAECHQLIDGIRPVGGNLALLRSLKKILNQAASIQCGAKRAKIKSTSLPKE